ncbi:MAG: YitT family protein, partial [Clostridiales bacterium]|nr:YitT family protein [Clostridiales bacterium]
MPLFKKNSPLYYISNLLLLDLGAIIAAGALEFFLVPVLILDGGVTGVAIIIHQLFSLPLGILVFILNLPFLFLGFRQMGKRFLLRAGAAMIIFSALLEIFGRLDKIVTDDPLLAAVFGGVFLGV